MKELNHKLLLLLILYLFTNINLFACECMCTMTTFEHAIESSDEIFTGNIIKIEKVKNGFYFFEDEKITEWIWKYQFKIDKKWKGDNSAIVTVWFAGNDCGIFDNINAKYLVYATRFGRINPNSFFLRKDNRLSTWVCSRTVGEYSIRNKERTFEKDIERLNDKFPKKIQLSKYSFGSRWLLIISLLLIVGIAVNLFYHPKKKMY